MVRIKNRRGFTLIELLIVIAILGIIAAIAYPSYQNYVKRGKRSNVKSELQTISQDIEKLKVGYKRYDEIPLSKLGFSNSGTKDFPSSTNKNYSLTITNADNNLANNWVIEAEPTNAMNGDGKIKLNSRGQKCWDGDGDCPLNAGSTWDY